MAADASIYQNLLARPKSVLEYSNEYAAQDDANQARQMNALRMQEAQAGMADKARMRSEQDALRNALAGGLDVGTPEGQQKLYGIAPMSAGEIIKSNAAIMKDKATAGAEEAKRLDFARAAQIKQLQFLGQVASGVTDQASYDFALQTIRQAGIDPTAIGAPPVYDPGVVKKFGDQALSMAERATQSMKEREFNLKANNELIGPDGKINQQVLGAKQNISRAGASTVSINTGQRGFENEMKLRGDFKSEPIYKAHQEVQSAYSQIKQSLDMASPVGDLAGATKIMKLLDPTSVVRESELGMAMQASGALDRLQNYASNVMNGTKLTPAQRKDFRTLADKLYGESVNQLNAKRSEYEQLGGAYQLNAGRALGPAAKPPEPAAKPGAPARKYNPATGRIE